MSARKSVLVANSLILVLICMCCGPSKPNNGTPTPTPNVPDPVSRALKDALLQSVAAGMEGDRFEKSGDYQNALEKYQQSAQVAESELPEYERHQIDPTKRAAVAYWLPALSHYRAARMQMVLRLPQEETRYHSERARDLCTSAIDLDHRQAPSGSEFTSFAWALFYVRGNTRSMLGQLVDARQDYNAVIRLNQGFTSAREQLALIDYLEGRNQSAASPGGLSFPKKPPFLSKKDIIDIVFAFLPLVTKKYGDYNALLGALHKVAVVVFK